MSTNRRGGDRVKFDRGVATYIMGMDGSWRRNCVMEDVSKTGCKITIKGSLDGLDLKQFFLVLSATGLAYRRCELMWMKEARAGVRFVELADKNSDGTAVKDKQPA